MASYRLRYEACQFPGFTSNNEALYSWNGACTRKFLSFSTDILKTPESIGAIMQQSSHNEEDLAWPLKYPQNLDKVIIERNIENEHDVVDFDFSLCIDHTDGGTGSCKARSTVFDEERCRVGKLML